MAWVIQLNELKCFHILRHLDSASRKALNSVMSPAEITDAIRSLHNGKSPEPDGFVVEFYKKFADQVTPILHRMFSDSTEAKRLPPTLHNANYSLLLKQDREETNPSLYRPISMLKLDFKNFTKILADRVNMFIESLIHTDQTGFIPNRLEEKSQKSPKYYV